MVCFEVVGTLIDCLLYDPLVSAGHREAAAGREQEACLLPGGRQREGQCFLRRR